TGQTYIFYGNQNGFRSSTVAEANVTINGSGKGLFGYGIEINDFNKDGIFDLVISASLKNLTDPYGLGNYTGQVYVFYGSIDGFHSCTINEANVTFNGTLESRFGNSLGSGDFNNDSFPDLVVGTPYANLSGPKEFNTGQVFIFYGSSDGLHASTDIGANVTFNGTFNGLGHNDTQFGWDIAVGDINFDNVDDLIVSAVGEDVIPGVNDDEGKVYIFYGNETWVSSNASVGADIIINGTGAGQIGFSILLADINHDNLTDLVLGANWKNTSGGSGNYQGQVAVFYNTPNGFIPYSVAEANITLNGTDKSDGFGFYMAAGDFNNNGINELVVSAPYSNLSGARDYLALAWKGQVFVYTFNFKPLNHTAIPAQSWNEDTAITLNLSSYFNDTNGDELNYTWDVGANIGASINEVTNIVTLTPTANWYGASSIIFYANDSYNSLTASNTVALTVANVNDCGDGTCESGETCDSCQADCGFCYNGGSSSTASQASHTVSQVQANENTEFNLGENTIVKKVKIKVNKELSNVKIEVKEKLTVSNEYSKEVYKYFEINAYQMTDDDIDEAEIEFDVEKLWLEDQNIEAANILLLRYTDSWNELETSLVSKDDNKYYFKAKTHGFSDFAISFKEQEVIEEEEEVIDKKEEIKEEVVEEVVEEPIEEKSYTLWYALEALVLLIIVALAVFFKLKNE
ncbi:MAG: FG-GAP repeat protein, partial [Nanoarchaeota archaeon]|nr:FG-GAP repeat protein [Nanoarchaeota archaeon]